MPHLLVSSSSDAYIPAIWNVDVAVGKNATKAGPDVVLIQYLMSRIGIANKIPGQSAVCAMLSKVKVTGSCDQVTLDAILAYQNAMKAKNPAATADGKISRANSSYSYGGAAWYTICQLNYDYKCVNWGNWPLIELDTSAPPDAIKNMVYKSLYGSDPWYS